jgi:phosphoserine phosphatase
MDDLYVISAVGKDKPGLVFSLANQLSSLNINIVDIEARSVRGHFMVFIVVDLSTSTANCDEMMARLNPLNADFDLGMRVEPYQAGRRKADKHLMLLTVMGVDRPGIVAAVSGIIAKRKGNIETIKMIARGEYIATEISLDVSELQDISEFRKALYDYSESSGLDVSLQEQDVFKKQKRVVIFDCDSTIIRGEVIDELAKFAGTAEKVQKMTDQAMNGEIDFNNAIHARVRLLKGLTIEQLELLTKTIKLTPGTEDLISTLHFMGYKVGVISGGFSFFTDYLKDRLQLDYVFANELEIENGVTTGKIKGEIIDAERKGEILKKIADMENISVDQIVAVGDGANDRFMLQNAGLAIAFSPKDILKEYSDGMLTAENISGLLYFLGVPASDQERIRNQLND